MNYICNAHRLSGRKTLTEKEETGSAQMYKKDLEILNNFQERKKIPNKRDAIRICIEFTRAHGGLE